MPSRLNTLWKRISGGDQGRRVFAAYMVLVFVIGVTAQGIASSAPTDESTSTPEPVVAEEPIVVEEPVAIEEAVEAPAEEPVEAPAEEPVEAPAEEPAAGVVAPASPIVMEIVTTTFHDDGADDAWGNGIYNGIEEEWLAGFAYEIYSGPSADGPWTYVTTAMSDANGEADLGVYFCGWYKVVQTLTDDQSFNGWECMTSGGVKIFEADGDQNAGLWFGLAQRTIIEVYKYSDDDEDGRHDDEEAMLSGWEFTLYDSAGNELRSGLTNDDGLLVFFPVPNGAYLVTETPQVGWENTTPLSRELAINGQCTEVWFGNSRDRGDLEVYKYYDNDEDGIHDGVEDMLEGWEFTLYDTEGFAVDSGLTDLNGLLVFSDLTPGDYTVVETLKLGWKNTTSLTQHVVVVDDQTMSVWFGNVEVTDSPQELDLAITKLVDDRTVDEGQLVTYTLTYWNLMADEDAYDYTIVDDYDERYITIVNANGGTVANGKISWLFAGPLSYEMGKQTLTYTARVSSDMPNRTTYIDNVVVIDDDRDFNYTNNTDDERIVYSPEGGPDDPFLPFTGGEYRMLFGFAVAAAVLGLLLRLRTDNAA